MTISHVQVLSLPVTDQDRALRLYTDVLGFDVVHDVPMPVGRWVQVRPPGAQTVGFADGIRKEPWGRYATFTDPDGNGLTLQTSSV